MRYHLQSKSTGKWLSGHSWVPESRVWNLEWADTRDQAELLKRSSMVVLLRDGQLSDCVYFRGEWADIKAPDGVTYIGRRLVRKNGVVLFDGCKYRHDKLIPYVGKHIFVEADGYWIIKPKAFKSMENRTEQGNTICDLEPLDGHKVITKS